MYGNRISESKDSRQQQRIREKKGKSMEMEKGAFLRWGKDAQ